MAVSRMQTLMEGLQRCLPDQTGPNLADADKGDAEMAAKFAVNVLDCCHGSSGKADLVHVASLLFGEHVGMLNFLKQSAGFPEFVESKVSLLDCLYWFLMKKEGTESEKRVVLQPHAVEIKSVLVGLFNRNKSAKMRNAVFPCLISLLQLYAGTSTGELLEPKEIMKRFFDELAKTQTPSTIQQNIYHLLGIIAKTYPEIVEKWMDKLLSTYLKQLKIQMTSAVKKPNLCIIYGCLVGLDNLLSSYPSVIDDEKVAEMFDYTIKSINFNKDLNRYNIVRAGFQLFSSQSSRFKMHIYAGYKNIHDLLKKWIKENKGGREMTNHAYQAMDVYFRQIANVLTAKAEADRHDSNAKEVFAFFMITFSNDICSGNFSRDVAMYIKGYGYFAAPCSFITNKQQVNEMYDLVLPVCERVFFNDSETDAMDNLPSLVEALANIVDQLDEVSDVSLLSIERMVVCMVEYLSRFHPSHRFLCYHAIIKIFVVVYQKGAVFKPFLNKIVYQSLLCTCSNPIVADTATHVIVEDEVQLISVNEFDDEDISYKNYMDFWKNILEAVILKEFNDIGVSLDIRQAVTNAVYDEIILSILTVVKKLDFTSFKLSDVTASSSSLAHVAAQPTSDPVEGLRASKPKDFQIFINVVDFCRNLLLERHALLFGKWVYKFSYDIIVLSTKFPLVSGFYKLLATCFKICSKIKYFITLDASVVESEKLAAFNLFIKFTKEVTVRLHQYKEDLLISCLRLILSLPNEIVQELVSVIIPAVELTFKLGVGYHPLVEDGLNALEIWRSGVQADSLRPLYKRVLALLNSYLKTSMEVNEDGVLILSADQRTKTKEKVKLTMKVLGKSKAKKDTLSTEVSCVKFRIVELIGELGNAVNHHLIDSDSETAAKRATAWDTTKHLRFDVPFPDMKLSIYLDDFLPKIVELALSSSNRQIKVAAAELLHSVVLFMLGTSVTKTAALQEKEPITKLYVKIFPALLQLSCDTDKVVRQLFEPLVLQLIHWFSKNRPYETCNTEALLNALLDGVGSDTDSALRDFCARCIKEFLVWSIKQTTPNNLKKNPFNTKALLKRLYHFCLHPKSSLRLGAALTFNSIYVVFREEDALVGKFMLEILVNFVESLAISQKDDQHLGTREQCKAALNHVQRIFQVKSDLFNNVDKNRRLPNGFQRGDLEETVVWLLKQCGRVEADCRHHCMLLVYNLAPHIKGTPTVSNYFQKLIKGRGVQFFVTQFEGDATRSREQLSLRSSPTLEVHCNETFVISAQNWFDVLLASLDCYIWVLESRLMNLSDFFSGETTSVLIKAIVFFMDNFPEKNGAHGQRVAVGDLSLTPMEIAAYNRITCTVIVRIMNFVQVVASDASLFKVTFLLELLTPRLWELLVACIIRPTSLGFDMSDTETMEALPKQMRELLSALSKAMPGDYISAFREAFSANVSGDSSSLNLIDILPEVPRMKLSWVSNFGHLVSGYQILHTAGVLMPALKMNNTRDQSDFAARLLKTVWEMCVEFRGEQLCAADLEGGRLDVAKKLLLFSFSLQLSIQELIRFISSKDVIHTASKHGDIYKGDLFFENFKLEIITRVEVCAPDSIEYIMEYFQNDPVAITKIIVPMLAHLVTHTGQRKKYGSEVVCTVSRNLQKIQNLCCPATTDGHYYTNVFLQIIVKLIGIDSKVATNPQHPAFSVVFGIYINFLIDVKTSLQFKGRLLDLLPFFAAGNLPDVPSLSMKRHLVVMASISFPMKSTEYSEDSVKSKEYKEVFKKVLSALVFSKSVVILEFLVDIMSTETKHVCEEDIQKSLVDFIKRVPAERHDAVLSTPFKLFIDEHRNPENVRRCALERVAIPMLRHVNEASLLAFYVKNVKSIMAHLMAKPTKVSDPNFLTQLTSRIGCFLLMEVLYARGSSDELSSLQSSVNSAFCDGSVKDGKELTKALTVAAHNAKKENMRGETEHLEVRRILCAAAYKALAEVIKCTQTELKFYSIFLFTENINKGDFLWDNLVDSRRTYNFEIEFTTLLEKRDQLIGIRRQSRASHIEGAENVEDDYASFPTSFHRLTTQNLADSSLSEDASQFDFTSSPQLLLSASGTEEATKNPSENMAIYYKGNVETIRLEMDELNRHECMVTLISIVRHLNQLYPPTSDNPSEMPSWMKSLQAKISDDATHTNVKLFIAKLVINTSNLFQFYAKWWLYPLMKLIMRKSCGVGLNYFIMDLMITMLAWSDIAVPQDAIERELAANVLEYLINNAFNGRTLILKSNLEVIKTVITSWKSCLEIPTKVIFDNFGNADKKGKVNLVGIHVLGVVLTNGFSPYTSVISVDRERFFKVFIANLRYDKGDVYKGAAEVLGLALKYYSNADSFLYEMVRNELIAIKKLEKDRFLKCLYWMQKNHPPIVDSFLSQVLFLLPNQYGMLKTHCLEIVLCRLDHVENVFIEMKQKNLMQMLTQSDDAVQQLCLEIVDKMLCKMTKEQVQEILQTIVIFSDHPNANLRRLMFEIVYWMYDNFCVQNIDETTPNSIITLCKNALLKGLSDNDERLRLSVFNFWSDESRLPTTTVERSVAILRTLYSPASEKNFLSYATYLLLELTGKSPDYKRKIIEHPLSDCQFHEYTVDTSWRARHSTLMPLFVESLSSQAASFQGSRREDGPSMQGGQLRATQGVSDFTATQNMTSKPFNWMTQSTFGSAGVELASADTTPPASALLFTVGTASSPKRRFTYKPVDPNFGQSKLIPDPEQADDSQNDHYREIRRLRRRFAKENDSTKAHHAILQARSQQRREQQLKVQKIAREAQVTMYRQYRIGDLPDVQIAHSAIIAPLQALAQGDDSVSKLLFSSLFRAILSQVKESDEETGSYSRVASDVRESFNRILSETTLYYPPVISIVQEISFEHSKEIALDGEKIASTAAISFQQSTAILLLEKMILEAAEKTDDSKKAKRARIDSSNKVLWFKLAELNKSQGNVDVARGIFAHKVGCLQQTREALDAETTGKYADALKVYETVKDEHGGNVNEMECAFWDDAIMKCCDQLSDWDKLQSYAMRKIDQSCSADVLKVWDDHHCQKQWLPYLVRSKLRLIMQGERDPSLTKFVDASLHDSKHPERKEILETNYCEELALLSIVQKKYNQARVYASLCIQRFLHDWASMSDLAVVHLRSRLCDLQKLVEMNNFLDVVDLDGDRFTVGVSNVAKRWKQTCPDTLVDISVTNDIVANRCMYLKILERKISDQSARMQPESEEIADDRLKCKLFQSKLAVLMSCVEAATAQNNFAVALVRLKESCELATDMADTALMARWHHVYVKMHLQRSKALPNLNSSVRILLNVWKQLKIYDTKKDILEKPSLLIEHHLLHSRVADALAVVMTEHEFSPRDFTTTLEYLACHRDSSDDVMHSLMKYSFEHLESTVSVASSPSDSDDRCRSAKANLQLAYFCDLRLRKADDGYEDPELLPGPTSEFPDVFMRSLLEAMKLGSLEAVQIFPRLLEIVEKYVGGSDLFREKVKEVPCWMFIRWISQIVALLDKPVAPALGDLIMDIAKQYPQALVYPFKVSSRGYSFESSSVGRRNAAVVEEIRSVLDGLWLVDLFVSALGQLKHPVVDYKKFHNNMCALMKSEGKREKCRKVFVEVQKNLFVEPLEQSSATPVPAGKFRKMVASDLGKLVEERFGQDGSKLLSMSFKEFANHQDTVIKKMSNMMLPTLLKDYCEWLSNFRSSAFSMELELPGQYTGLQKPIPAYHTKIAKFDDKVQVLASIQKPKAITVYGNDYKTYKFLVKGGEDLRLDQRIEQLFQVMNEIYAEDPACARRQLKLTTYQVTPLDDKLGLLEWVDNTTTLKEFLFNTPEMRRIQEKARSVVYDWIKREGECGEGRVSPLAIYNALYLHRSKSDVIKKYNEAVAIVPEGLFKNAFFCLSSSLEAFLTLRTHFIVSHAALCVSQYILGIGDRHLSNFMVSLETGGMVGIDFGHAFGSATQLLPIPELMPFRLTPQFLNLMKPMREHGQLMATMIHALSALRQNPTKLLNTMDIFIREPSLDWKEAALKVKGQEMDDDANVDWYPRQKVEFARRKLDGHDSREIMADELELRNLKGPVHHKLLEICLGGVPRSSRGTRKLEVEDQVSRLLEHAMDPNILSRAYLGWEAHV